VRAKASGSAIERSTWDSAAKFTTASQPSIASPAAAGSSMAPTTSSAPVPSMFSSRPA
jgi:hypothetical protein